MTSKITSKLNQLSKNIDFLTLRQRIGISFEENVKRKKYQKSQNLTKHGVENLVAMATIYTLNKMFFQNLILQ